MWPSQWPFELHQHHDSFQVPLNVQGLALPYSPSAHQNSTLALCRVNAGGVSNSGVSLTGSTNGSKTVTTQVTSLLAYDGVAVVLESSRIPKYALVLRSSRLVLSKNEAT